MNKQDLKKCQNILYNNINLELDGEEFKYILQVLKRHPSSERKIGCGVATISVAPSIRKRGQYYFVIQRIDGSSTDFSFYKCLSEKDYSHVTKVKHAFRTAIINQTQEFKKQFYQDNEDRNGYVYCIVTGLKMRIGNSNIDHHPESFDSLIKRFMISEKLEFSQVDIGGSEDGSIHQYLLDQYLFAKWSMFHKKEAQLRVIYWRANLQKPRI